MGLTTLLVALVPAASPAVAQTGDPAAGSPSGVIYEIPLDNARLDAAPRRRGGNGGGSGGDGSGDGQGTAGSESQGGTVSPIRSENGFGSSSTVPGAAGIAAKKAASGNDARASGTGGDGTGAQGSGGSSGNTAAGSAEGIRDAGSASITPSRSRAYVLLLLALVLAAGLGIAGRYVARRR